MIDYSAIDVIHFVEKGIDMWLITGLSLIGVIANIYKKRWGFLVWMVTNSIWCIYDYYIGAYAQSFLFLTYFILAIWGWFKWEK